MSYSSYYLPQNNEVRNRQLVEMWQREDEEVELFEMLRPGNVFIVGGEDLEASNSNTSNTGCVALFNYNNSISI